MKKHKVHTNYTRYHKVLAVIFAATSFAAVVSLIYYYQISHQIVLVPKVEMTARKATYTNSEYKFDLNYNKGFQLDTSGQGPNYFKNGGKTLVDVSIPYTLFPQTNLGAAGIVLAAKDKATAADCRTYVTGAGTAKTMTKTVAVDSGTYYTDSFKGAAAGTQYETKIYRLNKSGVCYEANLTVGISNIQNYEPGAVTEVVEADVWNTLSAMLVDVKFNN